MFISLILLALYYAKAKKSDGRETVLVHRKQEEQKERNKMKKQKEERGK